MISDTQIKKKLEDSEFLKIIKKYKEEQIECTNHTFFRLSQKQREIFTQNELKEIVFKEKPLLAGIQNNGNYAVFYEKEKNKTLKIILRFRRTKS